VQACRQVFHPGRGVRLDQTAFSVDDRFDYPERRICAGSRTVSLEHLSRALRDRDDGRVLQLALYRDGVAALADTIELADQPRRLFDYDPQTTVSTRPQVAEAVASRSLSG
jgi:hypothetical protein